MKIKSTKLKVLAGNNLTKFSERICVLEKVSPLDYLFQIFLQQSFTCPVPWKISAYLHSSKNLLCKDENKISIKKLRAKRYNRNLIFFLLNFFSFFHFSAKHEQKQEKRERSRSFSAHSTKKKKIKKRKEKETENTSDNG